MRSLAKAHGVTIKRHEQATHQNIREALRRHFKAAVAQEKGRLACFQLSASGGASEHSDSLARDSEHVLNSADVVDMRTLLLFRKQNKVDMPDHLQEAIKRIGGGYRANKQNLRDVAKLLGAVVQTLIRYPGGDKASRDFRRVSFTDALTMTIIRNLCFRRVRAWATTNPMRQSTSLCTPQTVLELAKMLRDPNGNLRCPFGADFETQSCTESRLDRSHRIPC